MKLIFVLASLLSVSLANAVEHSNCSTTVEVNSPVATSESLTASLAAKDYRIGEAVVGTPSLLINVNANLTGETLARTIIRVYSVEDNKRILVDEVTAFSRVRSLFAFRTQEASARKKNSAINASLRNALSLLDACEIK